MVIVLFCCVFVFLFVVVVVVVVCLFCFCFVLLCFVCFFLGGGGENGLVSLSH